MPMPRIVHIFPSFIVGQFNERLSLVTILPLCGVHTPESFTSVYMLEGNWRWKSLVLSWFEGHIPWMWSQHY